jgi:hypothetical protein
MPEQTYNIGYGSNDFFSNNNDEIAKTIPFHKGNLVAWVKSINPSVEIKSVIDVFDPKITAVVFVNKDKFINDYLPGNIIINSNSNFSNFDPRNVNLSVPPSALLDTEHEDPIQSGQLTIETTMNGTPITSYDLKPSLDKTVSSVKYTTNSIGKVNDDITLTGTLSTGEIQYPEPNGSISYISSNTANPRCKYQKKCTENHWHYKSCTTQTFVNKDGTTYCKCVCTGPKTLDGNEHQHCSPFNVTNTNPDGTIDPVSFKASIAELIKKITVSIKKQPEQYSYIGKGNDGKMTYPYQNFKFTDTDKEMRTAIYNYYYELNRNIELRKNIISNDSLDDTASQRLLDANVKYKKEYLHLFNIFSGILFVSGYIYVIYNRQSN